MLETQRLKELALVGLQWERDRIDSEIDAIKAQLGFENTEKSEISIQAPMAEKQPARPRKMTADGRRRLSMAAKQRWKEAHRLGKATL